MTDSTSSNNSKNPSTQVEVQLLATSNISSSTDNSTNNSTEIVSRMRTLIETIKKKTNINMFSLIRTPLTRALGAYAIKPLVAVQPRFAHHKQTDEEFDAQWEAYFKQ